MVTECTLQPPDYQKAAKRKTETQSNHSEAPPPQLVKVDARQRPGSDVCVSVRRRHICPHIFCLTWLKLNIYQVKIKHLSASTCCFLALILSWRLGGGGSGVISEKHLTVKN